MTDPTEQFFCDLHRRAHDRRLEIENGTIRFDISQNGQTKHWLVSINNGDITVSQAESGGDSAVVADRAAFNRLASGEAYFLTSVLRGEVQVEGNPRVLSLTRRLFPAPPASSAGPRDGGT